MEMEITRDEYLKALDIVEKYNQQIGLRTGDPKEDNIYKRFMKELDPDQELGEVNIERVIGTNRFSVTITYAFKTLEDQNYIRLLAEAVHPFDRKYIEVHYGNDMPEKLVHPYKL